MALWVGVLATKPDNWCLISRTFDLSVLAHTVIVHKYIQK